jgi:hypothetical protein
MPARARRAPPYNKKPGAMRRVLRKNGVLQLLRDPRLDDRLGGNLDRFAGGRVATHARLALLHDELHHAGKHELTGAFQFLLRERGQFFEELTRHRPLHFEAIGEV